MTSSLHLCTFIFLLAVATTGSGAPPLEPTQAVIPEGVREIASANVERLLVDHPETVIIDVRTEQERKSRGFILGSLHHDWFHLRDSTAEIAALDKNASYLIYDAIGGRAKLAVMEMSKLGFKNLMLLKGGFNAWTASGQAVAR